MKAVNLVGKTVNIDDDDNTHILGLVQFFYPDHKIMQKGVYFHTVDKLIYVGGRSEGDYINWRNRDDLQIIFAIQTTNHDIDFTDRTVILKFVYAKWGINADDFFTDDEIENITYMELFDFYNFIKLRWVSKSLCSYSETASMPNIHSIIGQDFNAILRFCEHMTDVTASILEMGLIGFIEKAHEKTKRNSKAYSRHYDLYKKFNAKFDNDYIALALSKYRDMENSKRFKLIWLLSQFIL
jgi:hypothetical protein